MESSKLFKNIGNVICKAHHIGSTAVPGLMAKPIIDIILEVKDVNELDCQRSKFAKLKYEVMGEFGIRGRRYYRKGGDLRTHQIHAFKKGDQNIVRHLAFREYLIEHKEVAQDYGRLKLEIAKRCNNDIEEYCDGKDEFIKNHESIAIKWYKARKQKTKQITSDHDVGLAIIKSATYRRSIGSNTRKH